MSGLLCLKWNNHTSAFYKTLNNHRSKELYCDTTIACRGKYYPVHRLVLTTCSEYFEEIFERTQCKHPFIIIKDIQPSELEALLNYMYKGEVNVLQDMLPGLIKAAESLKIRGLAVPDDDECSDDTKEKKRSCTSSPPPFVKKSRKVMKKANRSNDSRLSVSPCPIEVEPEIISIEPQTSIIEEPSEILAATLNNKKFISNKSNGKQVSLLYDQDSSNSNYKQDDSSLIRPKSKGNSEELRDDDDDEDVDDDDDDDNIELEDVKVEALDIVPMDDMDENQYPLSETEVDSKTETEGSLFRTLLGGDDSATSKKKLKNSNSSENHPMAQCSTWDDNLEHSNDGSHLNSDEMQDEIIGYSCRDQLKKKGMDELESFLDLPPEFLAQFNSNIFNLAQNSPENSKKNETRENSSEKEFPSKKRKKLKHYLNDVVRQCPFCPYKTKVQAHVKRHIMCKHTNERPHKCDFCPYSTANKSNMKMHLMIHTGERQFGCPYCGYKAIRKDYMTRHIRSQHPKQLDVEPSRFVY